MDAYTLTPRFNGLDTVRMPLPRQLAFPQRGPGFLGNFTRCPLTSTNPLFIPTGFPRISGVGGLLMPSLDSQKSMSSHQNSSCSRSAPIYNPLAFPPSTSLPRGPLTTPFPQFSLPHSVQSTSRQDYYNHIGVFDYTLLESERIACFDVGGEKRLCLPQVLHLLPQFNISEINQVLEDLAIVCSRCNIDQLGILKEQGVLPGNINSCGLITKSDAERLCKTLLYKIVEKNQRGYTANSFNVRHNCFGKQGGIFIPELYTSSSARCIECSDCGGLFGPDKFVGHSHHQLERRTCHWGFDSAHWRHYLFLAREQTTNSSSHTDVSRLLDFFDTLKSKFSSVKRKSESSQIQEDNNSQKRLKTLDELQTKPQLASNTMWKVSRDTLCKLRYKDGTPTLEDPNRVVLRSEAEQFDMDYAPNIALSRVDRKKLTCQPSIKEEPLLTSEISPDDITVMENRLIRGILELANESSSEKDKLLLEFSNIRTAYTTEIKQIQVGKIGAQETKGLHSEWQDRISSLEQENQQLRQESKLEQQKNMKTIRDLACEVDSIQRQLHDAGNPGIHKMRIKYAAIKDQLASKTNECCDWKRRYEAVEKRRNRLSQRFVALARTTTPTNNNNETTETESETETKTTPPVFGDKLPTVDEKKKSFASMDNAKVTKSPDSSAALGDATTTTKTSRQQCLWKTERHHRHRHSSNNSKSKHTRRHKGRNRHGGKRKERTALLAEAVIQLEQSVTSSADVISTSHQEDEDLEPPDLERAVDEVIQ